MKSLKIFAIVFLFSFSLYAQNDNIAPKPADKPKTEKKYIDMDELRAMKANGATDEEVNARYNEMIEAIDHDFHGVPVKKMKEQDLSTKKNAAKLLKDIKPISL